MPPPHSRALRWLKNSVVWLKFGELRKKYFPSLSIMLPQNDLCVDLLKNQFCLLNSLVYDGALFHLSCCAHILNLIVQDGLKQIDVAVEKIRVTVKYIRGSHGRKVKFQ